MICLLHYPPNKTSRSRCRGRTLSLHDVIDSRAAKYLQQQQTQTKNKKNAPFRFFDESWMTSQNLSCKSRAVACPFGSKSQRFLRLHFSNCRHVGRNKRRGYGGCWGTYRLSPQRILCNKRKHISKSTASFFPHHTKRGLDNRHYYPTTRQKPLLPPPPPRLLLPALKSKNGMLLPCGVGIFVPIRARFVAILSMNQALNIKPILVPPTIMDCPLRLGIAVTCFILIASNAGLKRAAFVRCATRNGILRKLNAFRAMDHLESKKFRLLSLKNHQICIQHGT